MQETEIFIKRMLKHYHCDTAPHLLQSVDVGKKLIATGTMFVDVGKLLFQTADVMSSALSKAAKTTTGLVVFHGKQIADLTDKCTCKFGKIEEDYRAGMIDAGAIDSTQAVLFPSNEVQRKGSIASVATSESSQFTQVRSFDEDDTAIITDKDVMRTLRILKLPALVTLPAEAVIVGEELLVEHIDSEAIKEPKSRRQKIVAKSSDADNGRCPANDHQDDKKQRDASIPCEVELLSSLLSRELTT